MSTLNTQSPAAPPEFLPLPPRGLDPVFGLSRTGYYSLEKLGLIRLIRVRKPGNQQGRTLVDCQSVRNYLAKLARSQANEHTVPENASSNDKTASVETADAVTNTVNAAETIATGAS